MAQVKITQIRSIIDRPEKQKRTIAALGLGRPNYSRVHNDTPQLRGMLTVVRHLVKVEPVNG
ncbi:MAG: 50S ribosomal protein L30 [Chlorobi bacterium]|jgi:large subunit ribosomal protein L30|nr:50S ribosomal protein L30 [Chlorobiota bacterium]MBL7988010.1 50S ribosomal protein L30 [Chlorobiota bacterium]MBX7215809.1 50S ribosomal protein L30 [Candidatus Kapabacteria bacterium]MCE7934336.1 50S ribosomal protein L30 [Chlorobi bacterium CHB2]